MPCHVILSLETVYVKSVFGFICLSLDNDVMATLKRCVKLFPLIFILKNIRKNATKKGSEN